MVADGDRQLREQLDSLRINHFEQQIDDRAYSLVQQEAHELDATSTERAIIESAKVLRDRIIDV